MPDGTEQQVSPATVVDAVIIMSGVALFALWLLSTSLGRKALANSKPRRTSMAWYTPFAVFFLWLTGIGLFQIAVLRIFRDVEDWQRFFLSNVVASAGAVGTVVIILVVARLEFARGLRGFGLRPRTIPKDVGYAFVTLLAIWPLVAAAMSLTILATQKMFGREFEVPQHEALEVITHSTTLPVQVLIVILAVVIAPLVEEMLFRGLFQTMIRSYVRRPWPAIVMTSILFAAIHVNATHWPSLFVLGLGLGYAYEKSNSLLRPIFMHAMFNGITIAVALTQQGSP